MDRLRLISLVACVLIVATANGDESKGDNGQEYYLADHGCDGGLTEMTDLTKVEGFDKVQTKNDLAKFASKVPGAVGFTAHPQFESGTRYASAVLWYTSLSPSGSSWPLYLFDEAKAKKKPGERPEALAVAAAEAKVTAKSKIAQELIDAGGPNGVKLSGSYSYQERKVLALAVMRLEGAFAHPGEFGVGHCGACRSVVAGGNPRRCGLGVRNLNHWNCCGASEDARHCRYWALIKAQDDAEQTDEREPE
ncbi:MAG: hypothetical protein GTO14_24470 [Anaerolineales bacterium]|nr:hypothetical protein [Anaerolineales bacterium]